jgi:hypothetical protein
VVFDVVKLLTYGRNLRGLFDAAIERYAANQSDRTGQRKHSSVLVGHSIGACADNRSWVDKGIKRGLGTADALDGVMSLDGALILSQTESREQGSVAQLLIAK